MGIYYIIIPTFLYFFFQTFKTKEFFKEIQKERKRMEKKKEKEKGMEGRRKKSKEKEFIFLHTDSLVQKQFIKIVIPSFSFCSTYQILKQL